MSKWRAERMGTAAHYENPRTIERMQRDFDGIEELSTKKPQTRADLRRMKRERDIEDEYVPDTSMQDVTGRRDKDAGKTFSHRHEKDMPLWQQKEIAAHLIDCPKDVSRAGLYDTITIRDEDEEEYERELDFPITKTPPIFNAFRGERVGVILHIGGFAYQLVKVQKADGRVFTIEMLKRARQLELKQEEEARLERIKKAKKARRKKRRKRIRDAQRGLQQC